MLYYEDLYIKISDDFNNEIDALLSEIDKSVTQNYWFNKKSIRWKIVVVKDVLLSLNKNEFRLSQILPLLNHIVVYKEKVEKYIDSNDIATCFIYFYPENYDKTHDDLTKLMDYSFNFRHGISEGKKYMIGLGIKGFPVDCAIKFTAKKKNGNIIIEIKHHPTTPAELQRGGLIGNLKRSRMDHERMYGNDQRRLIDENFEDYQKEFLVFANETNSRIINTLENFGQCIDLCNSLIESIKINPNLGNLSEIEHIYSILQENNYINISKEKFISVFNTDFSGEKLTWLKSGPSLKYFLDQINEKFKVSNEINKWAETRFRMEKPINNLSVYLGKQGSTNEYSLLSHKNLKRDPLYILFRE
jgi:hypothetical protein